MIRPSTWKDFPRYVPSVHRLMGEGSGGRSATCPTAFRSRSVRTRMEWQKGHTACTALDQRNWTGAPQLGQFAPTWLMESETAALVFGRSPTALRTPAPVPLQTPRSGGAGSRRRSGTATDARGRYGTRCATPLTG